MRVVEAHDTATIAVIRELFEEYWNSFGFTPCFQGFAQEVANLPGSYTRLGLLLVNGEAAGCVALRPLDEVRGEFKRLYVRPGYRGMGCGRFLLDWVIEQARTAGYCELFADTMPEMRDALAMYERAGFERTGPYGRSPTPGAVYLRLKL
jgi:putative acetyltransferase